MKIRVASALTASLALALSVSACGGSSSEGGGDNEYALVSDGSLTVCSDIPYAPFEFEDPESPTGYSGFDMDLVAEIAAGLELEPSIKVSSFDALQSGLALNSNQCDMVASAMTITEDRKANLAFADPYYDSQQSLLVPADSDIKTIDDLDGKKVGVQQGTTGQAYAEENAKGAELVVLPSDAEMFQAIQAGQVEALLQDLPVNLEHTKEEKYQIVEEYSTGESYGFAFKKDNDALVTAVNEQLTELRDSGTYDEIYDKYFSTDAEG